MLLIQKEGKNLKMLYLNFLIPFQIINIKFYCGKTGIGKTVTLLNYRFKNKNVSYIYLRIIFKYCKTTNKLYEALKK